MNRNVFTRIPVATAAVALGLLAGAAALAFTVPDCPFADGIALFVPGPASAGDPDHALGAPSGQGAINGSTDTLTLGVSGSVSLHLSTICFDGAGTDLIVCENPFQVLGTGGVFIEALVVEVSTDGTTFARFPAHYSGQTGPFPPFTGQPLAWYRGFAGVLPVFANPALAIPVLDVVAAGGDAFDLADLADDPAVLSGAVDLGDIRYVRLRDVQGGTTLDSDGHTVWDSGLDTLSSADVDAVIAVNSTCAAIGGQPAVELSLNAGFLSIRIEDPDGFSDIKPGLTASVNGTSLPFAALLPFFAITQFDPHGVTLVTGPIPTGLFPVTIKVSARDHTELYGGDALTLP